MSVLHQTQETLAELNAQDQIGFGSHLLPEVQTGVPGLVLGQVDFNPRRDTVRSIVHSSIREMVTGQPQVRQVAPYQQLAINFVTHQPKSDDAYGLPAIKANLANVLYETVAESLPGITDYLQCYQVGVLAVRSAGKDTMVVATDGTPEADAAAIAKITRQGLTFVVSDFMHLPLEQHKQSAFPATVGLKVNHPLELQLSSARVGRIATIGGGEINTNRPRQVERYNQDLDRLHAGISARLGMVGVNLAQIVAHPRSKTGLDLVQVDREVSSALRKTARH